METQYWDGFYKSQTAASLIVPSQFAAFAAIEFGGNVDTVVEVGCGSGRDSIFFAASGFKVIGLDESGVAVDSSRKLADANSVKAMFLHFGISDLGAAKGIQEYADENTRMAMYARFFLHAINEQEQKSFFKLARDILKPDGLLAVEFRTDRDQKQEKVTPEHYRRYIEPACFAATASDEGFKTNYFVEGFGFAKYKADDAHVARFILQKR